VVTGENDFIFSATFHNLILPSQDPEAKRSEYGTEAKEIIQLQYNVRFSLVVSSSSTEDIILPLP